MSWIDRRRKKREDEAAAHPAPIELDLGVHPPTEVEVVVARLKADGANVYLYAQEPTTLAASLAPKRCHVLVAPDDEARVRMELEAAGLLLPGGS